MSEEDLPRKKTVPLSIAEICAEVARQIKERNNCGGLYNTIEKGVDEDGKFFVGPDSGSVERRYQPNGKPELDGDYEK